MIKHADVKIHKTVSTGVKTNSNKRSMCVKEAIAQVLTVKPNSDETCGCETHNTVSVDVKTNSNKCLGERSCSTSIDLKTVIKYVDVKAHRTCVGVQTNSNKTSVCVKEFITQVLMSRQTVTKQVFTLEVKPPLFLSDEKLAQSTLTNDQTLQSFLTNEQTGQSFLTNDQTLQSFLTSDYTASLFIVTYDQLAVYHEQWSSSSVYPFTKQIQRTVSMTPSRKNENNSRAVASSWKRELRLTISTND